MTAHVEELSILTRHRWRADCCDGVSGDGRASSVELTCNSIIWASAGRPSRTARDCAPQNTQPAHKPRFDLRALRTTNKRRLKEGYLKIGADFEPNCAATMPAAQRRRNVEYPTRSQPASTNECNSRPVRAVVGAAGSVCSHLSVRNL